MSNDRILYDITPFTHLDYPGKLAAIAWFVGCNMRCMYCYNADIVFAEEGRHTPEELLAFLGSRRGLLDGVVLSGGEPTLHDLEPICEAIKSMGFSVKLDTNGTLPKKVERLVEKGLVDTIALDFKAQSGKFGYITGSGRYRHFLETLDYLVKKDFDFEVRTTVHADLLGPEDIASMAETLLDHGYKGPYYLQRFVETPNNIANIGQPKRPFDEKRFQAALPIVWR
ncbi:anaerobic ribonucleoside-triphosphate reductase activating protein [Hydrogenimonas sp.]